VSNVPDPRVVDSVRARLRNVAARENYEGVRIELLALLERTRIHIQVDVGFGDATVPAPT